MSRSRIVYFGFCLVLLVLIVWRYQVIESRIENNELRRYNDLEEEITLIGKVVKEPDVRDTNTKLTIEARPLENFDDEENRGRASTKLLVTVNRYPEYKYGDELKITGKLQTPAVFEGFNYRDYLKKDGIYSVVYWPKVELLSRGKYRSLAPYFYSRILEIKNKLREVIYKNLSPPQSSILGAMILGDKSMMSQGLKEKLNIAGVRHITAVSGMHVLILSTILMSLLLGLGFWRNQAFYISIIIIWLFIIMTGLQVSGIRAGIMGTLFILAQGIGRKSVSSRAIVIAAGLMLVINPLLLFYDVGFQLSFLAALGIISLAPFLKRWLKLDILAISFSAYIFTLPILIYNFGRISLVAPLTNVLILPIIYWIMIFGFVFALAGLIWLPFAWILSFPCWFLLTYIVKIVDFFSKPWAEKSIENIHPVRNILTLGGISNGVHWLWLIICYLILGFFVLYLKNKKKDLLRFKP